MEIRLRREIKQGYAAAKRGELLSAEDLKSRLDEHKRAFLTSQNQKRG
jgi:hypothetical protein